MKSEKKLCFGIAALFFLISGCQEDTGKNDYSGVSDLISDRNKARYEVAESTPKKTVRPQKKVTDKAVASTSKASDRKDELASVILYEEKVQIVGSDSGRTLAKGVAYVNKKGQIVRIKILKE